MEMDMAIEFYFKQLEDYTQCVTGYQGFKEEVTIPAEWYGQKVTVLYDDLFKNHKEITKVNLPDTLTDIGGFVFDGCENLRHIELPKSVTEMWQYAFVRSGIEEITLPPCMTRISPFVFSSCEHLKSVTCNKSLKKIHSWAFKNCRALTDFYVSRQTELSDKTFEGCENVNIHYID